MPNSKLRQIYLAILRSRLLAVRLGRAANGWVGLEACLVSTAVDLTASDLISDAAPGKPTAFLRGESATRLLGIATKRTGIAADCGAGSRLPEISAVRERLWAAVGAAQALQAAYAAAKTANSQTARRGVAIVYLRPAEAGKPLLRDVLACAAKQELPLIFVLMPGAGAGGVCALSRKAGVPGIAVDAADAVAIYRVAQESMVRARSGGGPALIECVPFVLEGRRRPEAADALSALETYLMRRGVCTQAWIDRAASSFTSQLETPAAK